MSLLERSFDLPAGCARAKSDLGELRDIVALVPKMVAVGVIRVGEARRQRVEAALRSAMDHLQIQDEHIAFTDEVNGEWNEWLITEVRRFSIVPLTVQGSAFAVTVEVHGAKTGRAWAKEGVDPDLVRVSWQLGDFIVTTVVHVDGKTPVSMEPAMIHVGSVVIPDQGCGRAHRHCWAKIGEREAVPKGGMVFKPIPRHPGGAEAIAAMLEEAANDIVGQAD